MNRERERETDEKIENVIIITLYNFFYSITIIIMYPIINNS